MNSKKLLKSSTNLKNKTIISKAITEVKMASKRKSSSSCRGPPLSKYRLQQLQRNQEEKRLESQYLEDLKELEKNENDDKLDDDECPTKDLPNQDESPAINHLYQELPTYPHSETSHPDKSTLSNKNDDEEDIAFTIINLVNPIVPIVKLETVGTFPPNSEEIIEISDSDEDSDNLNKAIIKTEKV